MSPKNPPIKKTVSKKASALPKETQKMQPTLLSGVAYITVIGWFVAYFAASSTRTEHDTFHIRQSFGIHMTMLVFEILGTFSMIPYFLIQFLWLAYVIIMIVLAIQGLRAQKTKILFLGDKFQEWFSFL